MKKRILALLLCAAMALVLLTGCGEAADQQILDKASEDTVSYLTDGKLKSDTTVMTIGGQEVSASYYLYWLGHYYIAQMNAYASYFGQSLDLSAEVSEGVTMIQSIQDRAENAVISYIAMEQKAEEYGLALSEEELSDVQKYMDTQDEYAMLYFCTNVEDQGKIYTEYQLGQKLQEVLYGEGGEREITDATLQDYIVDNGIYNCRYILCKTEDDSTDEEVEEMKQKCQDIYEELSQLEGEEQLERFKELQAEENADGNTEECSFDSTASLVEGFREKLAEMEIGELGMTDKTGYGYFTLLRLDVDLDMVKEEYISNDFAAQMAEWSDAVEVVKADAYDSIDAQAFCEGLMELQTTVKRVQQAEAEAASSGADAS